MQTDRTTKALLGIIVFLSLGSPQAGMALQDGSAECEASTPEVCRVQAEAGDAVTQFNLGVMCDNGEGVPENDTEAVRWYRMAAEQGVAAAQVNLGVMCDNGEGVVQDDVRAYLWFNLAVAASQGDERAFHVEARDRVADRLSPAELVAMQRLATQCQASGFKDCGEPE
jgi:TPR repeat protein